MSWKLKFGVIWSGQAISVFTSSVLQMAIIWYIALTTNSALLLSLASFAGFLPMAVLGSFAGAFVDRWNRKFTMIGADLYIALISTVLGVYALFASPPLWLILAVLFFRSIGSAFHTPAISAVTPLLVPEEFLTKCAGYTQSIQTIGFIAGTSVAAVLFPIWGLSGMVWLDVGGAILASAAVLFVKIPSPPKTEDSGKAEKPGMFSEIKSAFEILRAHKGLFVLLWGGTIFMMVYSPINALYPLMSLDYFGGTTTEAAIAEIAFAIGMTLGGVILGIWGGFKKRNITMTISILFSGLPLAASGLLPPTGFVFFAAFSFLVGFSVPLYTGPHTALMQEKIPPGFLGRVFGLYGSLMSIAMLIGLVVSGTLAEIIGVNTWFLISGLVIASLAVVMFLNPHVRNIEKD